MKFYFIREKQAQKFHIDSPTHPKLQFMQLRKESLMKNSGIAIVCRGQGFETRQARIMSGFFSPNRISCNLNCKYVLYIFSISSINIVTFGKLVVWYSHWYLICRSMLTYLRWSVKQKAYINSTHFLDKYNLKRKQKYNK